MLVLGDVVETHEATWLRAEVQRGLSRILSHPAGIDRHAALAAIFLAAADLCRGLVDRDMARIGYDDRTETTQLVPSVMLPLARLVDRSWRTGRLGDAELDIASTCRALAALSPAGPVRCKPMEGHAFYCLYPEAYAEAARRSRLPPSTMIIGIRSIGMGLAAMVAAALGGDGFVTLRPVGHPFDRRIAVSGRLRAAILSGQPSHFAIVDEGPGLSGSSFLAVAEWLERQGVDRGAIHLFPGHDAEPGRQAGSGRLARWRAAPRHHVGTDALLGERLGEWVAGLVGPLDTPLADISGGAWRDHVTGAADVALRPRWERRKFLASAAGRRWLVKFAGLGNEGRHKLALARRLHQAGFGTHPAGLCHGFLVQAWCEAPNLAGVPLDREALVGQLGAYLAFRARIPAPPDGGATLEQLAHMAKVTARETLGELAGNGLGAWLRITPDMDASMRRVETDGALHRWEWLVDGGRLVKTDAVDHTRGHDLVGRQDIAWDVAGAIVEHRLAGFEIARLVAAIEEAGVSVSPALARFMLPSYLAFQLGSWSMGAGEHSPQAVRYARLLRLLIAGSEANPAAIADVAPQWD